MGNNHIPKTAESDPSSRHEESSLERHQRQERYRGGQYDDSKTDKQGHISKMAGDNATGKTAVSREHNKNQTGETLSESETDEWLERERESDGSGNW